MSPLFPLVLVSVLQHWGRSGKFLPQHGSQQCAPAGPPPPGPSQLPGYQGMGHKFLFYHPQCTYLQKQQG